MFARYLSQEEVLDLDWENPWFSRFRNRNLKPQIDAHLERIRIGRTLGTPPPATQPVPGGAHRTPGGGCLAYHRPGAVQRDPAVARGYSRNAFGRVDSRRQIPAAKEVLMKHLTRPIFPFLLLAAACSTTPVPTQPARPIVSLALEPIEEEVNTGEEAEEEEEEFRQHAVNLFLGGAHNQANHTGFALGVDYEYKFNPHWGAGAFAEGATGDLRSFVGGVLAYYHPIEPLALVAGPGLERERGHEFRSAEWSAVLRVGGFYEIPVTPDMVVAPAVYYDIAEGDNTFIFGINIGTSF